MTEIINFEDWLKFELRIGEVKKIKNQIVINCNNKEFKVSDNLDLKNGDKIVVGINGANLMIPVINENIPLIPEKDAEAGMRVS